MPDINIGALSEAINEKMDRDAQNVDTVSGADCVIEFQVPTADNNYTWYRKYKSGWVEQGGFFGVNTSGWASDTITYPVTMANLNYQLIALGNWSDAVSSSCKVTGKTTSTAVVTYANNLTSIQYSVWQVSGMAQ